jgi:GTP pyrophosphokinase
LAKLRLRATREQKVLVRKAFILAVDAHKGMRRHSGEPYIIHPLEVAMIVLDQMNLGATSVICALLHDVVEDTDYTLQDIEGIFGKTVAEIIDGLTKIEEVTDTQISRQFETFRKILLSMSKDARVILIKLADRLHNMRTLESMPSEKQQKIASETVYMYAPLAHRLGFYNIKNELEDLSMKYHDPGSYEYIAEKIRSSEAERDIFIEQFIEPIRTALSEEGMKYEILSRTKSIASIWQKMNKKQIPFEEVFDLFAIRIILDVDDEHQKSACWSAYAIVTDSYKPNLSRLRDWITTPKTNGYQSLHTTVMSKTGKWVEVQIRSKQMDTIAENGFAAHWVYKEDNSNYEKGVDAWLANLKEILQKAEINTGDLVANVKLNLYSKEIFVFTQKGEEHTMPEKSTVIDFAYMLSENEGSHCIGAKVNNKLTPPSHVLHTGDQIEIITSKKQKVLDEWLTFAVTSKAIEGIRKALEKQQEDTIEQGKKILKDKFKKYDIEVNKSNRDKLMSFFKYKDKREFYLAIYHGKITDARIKRCFSTFSVFYRLAYFVNPVRTWIMGMWKLLSIDNALRRKSSIDPKSVLLGESVHEIKQTIASCCNPVAGDSIIAFNLTDKEIIIHRSNCNEAIHLSARYGDRIVKAKWRPDEDTAEFLAGIYIEGFDNRGLVYTVMGVIHQDFQVNCRSVQFETSDNIFKGNVMLYIQNVEHLDKLMERLRLVKGVEKVERINSYYGEKKKK